MMRCRLLAIDLDGTLIRDDGTLDPRDRAAISRARANGILVTLATGRLPDRTLPCARELGLTAPLVCADGAITIWPLNGVVRTLKVLSIATLTALLELAERVALPTAFLTPDGVLSLERHASIAGHFAGWSDRFESVSRVDELLAPARAIVTGFLVGTAEQIAFATGLHGRAAGRDQVDGFPVGKLGHHALRVLAPRVGKGRALAALARTLKISRAETAAVGDWYNDLSMLSWASWSFAMGHAPDDLAQVARRRLRATACEGGAIAEVVDELLDGTAA